ncbi:hypothetical protein [Siccibacter colletis]|uniref:Uncharacterized protein n=1 Tax=Siccibacter colletis TaxID=1505757 RepID=A0ABY6JKJ6_9ENTR|nr:hypothetical protein [Siccibacter colletis]UYU33359.1 hypothetical protein KFZ77_07590 [Siccibacter colletis]
MDNEKLHYIDLLKLQYERIAQHENQRLMFSSLVLTITLAVVAVIFSKDNEITAGLFVSLCFLLIVINVFACLFVRKSRYWIKFHQKRARIILSEYNPELKAAVYNDGKKSGETCCKNGHGQQSPEKPNSDLDIFKRPGLQLYLHAVLIIFLIGIMLTKFNFNCLLID